MALKLWAVRGCEKHGWTWYSDCPDCRNVPPDDGRLNDVVLTPEEMKAEVDKLPDCGGEETIHGGNPAGESLK